jgi:uncharacterized phage protein gp47/JayE
MAEKIAIPTRDEIIRKYERDYQLRVPGAKVGEGTQPGIDARVFADQLLPLYAEAQNLGGAQDLENLSGTDLEDEAEDLGLPRRLAPAGASGGVSVTTSVGGAAVQVGQKLVNKQTGLRYQCIAAGVYVTGNAVPLAGIDTGPNTNLKAGVVLEWASPPPGLAPTAVVLADADGQGLTGGRLEESDPEIRDRIRTEKAAPALAGNSADYRSAAVRTPNVAVQAAFVFSTILGPGTVGLAFTMRPATSGASRRPNAAQISAVRANVIGKMPGDDSLFMYALVADTVNLDLLVRWRRTSAGWTDADAWPAYSATYPVYVSAATDATHFTLTTLDGTAPAPHLGQTIGFFDKTNRVFVRKRILSVTGAVAPWAIVCDESAGASDLVFVPAVNDRPMPWSESLSQLVAPVLAEFDKLGPGDHISFDAGGLRMKRDPSGYEAYPYELSGRALTPLYTLSPVDDVRVAAPSLPHTPPTGTPGVDAYIVELGALRVFPL